MKRSLVSTIALCLLSCGFVFADDLSPVGYWVTTSDDGAEEEAIIRIELHGQELRGEIHTVLRDAETTNCERCKGELKGQPIIGLPIITGMVQNGETWSGGRILDPQNGKLYKATLRMTGDGDRLKVRGYIGVPALGRSQEWRRADPGEVEQAVTERIQSTD